MKNIITTNISSALCESDPLAYVKENCQDMINELVLSLLSEFGVTKNSLPQYSDKIEISNQGNVTFYGFYIGTIDAVSAYDVYTMSYKVSCGAWVEGSRTNTLIDGEYIANSLLIKEKMEMKENKIKWVLYDESHPVFNIWEAFIADGESYLESFFKGEDPNKMSQRELKRNERIMKEGK